MYQPITTILAMWTLGLTELIVTGVIVLFILCKKRPNSPHALGASFTEFRKAIKAKKDIKNKVMSTISFLNLK